MYYYIADIITGKDTFDIIWDTELQLSNVYSEETHHIKETTLFITLWQYTYHMIS